MNKLNKKKILKDLASFYKVRVVLKKNHPSHASVDLIKDIIYIEYKDSYPLYWLLTNFFHEYAHLYCKYNNYFPLYHSDIYFLTKKQRSHFLKTIWRAESFVDKLGAQFLKTHFNNHFKFVYGYIESQKHIFLPETILEMKQFFKYVDLNKKIKKSQNETKNK